MDKKYFTHSTYTPSPSMKSFSGFNSMISLDPNYKPKQTANSSRNYYDKPYNPKPFTYRKQSSKPPSFLSSSERLNFKSAQKISFHAQSSKNLNSTWKLSTNSFFKKKEFTSFKQITIRDEKYLRDSDSTKCQSPKAKLSQSVKISDFKKLRLIGNGKYGSVYMVKHLQTGFVSALKIIRKIDIDSLQRVEKQKMINQLIREIKIQSYLDHPNLVKLYNYFSDDYNIYLLMELGCDGQLYDIMKKKPKLQQDSVSIITREILEGLSYMHKAQIIHRDIKPENVVLIHGFAKICDFGWSVVCSKQLRSTLCGTPLYLSPQILKGNLYNQKIDTWAIGTLAFQLYTSDNPFKIKKKEDLSKIITEDFVMRTGSVEMRNFITLILKKDPNKRPDSEKLKSHEFIRKYKNIETSQEICGLVYRRELNVHRSYFK